VSARVAQGERKLATLLFADLSGYTDMTRRLDPEDVVSVVDPVMRDLQRIAEAHGGTVLMVAGDGLLCAFGLPHTSEDDALRAVRAAVEMRRRAAGTQGLHAGLASGEVLVSPDESQRGWGVTGLCVALATRLADQARNGVILADRECRRLAADAVHWGVQTDLVLQGMGAQAVSAHEVLDTGDAPSARTRGTFVDRYVERARLDDLLARVASDRTSRVATVGGDAGAGKSRTLETWCADHPDVTVVLGRCHAYGDERPLAPLVDALVEHLRLHGLLEATALTELLTGPAGAEAEAVAARLLAMAEGRSLPVEDMVGALAHGLRYVMSALAGRQPLVVIVDDVHWAGADVTRFLTTLENQPIAGPVLVIVLQREGTTWGEPVALEALPAWAAKQLVISRVGEPPRDLLLSLIERTGGNPLYLEECLSLLVENGAVERDGDTCVVGEPAGLTTLPASVRAILSARLDALPSEAKELALVASASADFAPGAALLSLSTSTDSVGGLRHLVALGVLQEVFGNGYRFSHRLLQEVAYAALTKARRVELHLGFLEMLPEEPLSLRAFHAESAWNHLSSGSSERARVAVIGVRELRRLGEMVFTWQAGGAEAVFRRAEPMLVDLAPDDGDEASLLLGGLSQALMEQGRLGEAVEVGQRAVATSRSGGAPSARATAHLALGHALARHGDIEQARSELDEVLALADQLQDARLKGRALWALADSYRFESTTRFQELLEGAHKELDVAGDEWGRTQVERLLAYLASMSGGPDFARWFARAEAGQSLDDLRGRAMLARTGGFVAAGQTDWPTAASLGAEAEALGRRAGLGDVITDALLLGIEAATFLGDLDRGLALAESLPAAATDMSARTRHALASEAALLRLRRGEQAQAAAELRITRELLPELGESEATLAHQAAAEVALDSGLWSLARARAAVGCELAEAVGADLVAAQLKVVQLRAALAQGDRVSDSIADVATAAARAGTERLSVLLAVLAEQDQLGNPTAISPVPPDTCIEARAIWFENAAMRATDADEARAHWQRAHEEWCRIGHTIWRERAQQAMQTLPRNAQELAQIALTPLLDEAALGAHH